MTDGQTERGARKKVCPCMPSPCRVFKSRLVCVWIGHELYTSCKATYLKVDNSAQTTFRFSPVSFRAPQSMDWGMLRVRACFMLIFMVRSLSMGAHTLFIGQRERERCRICAELLFLFLKGIMGALAPFSYLVLISSYWVQSSRVSLC